MATLKEFLRDVRQEHDSRIATKYVAKEDLDFTADDVSDIFDGALSPGTTTTEKLTPSLTISKSGEMYSYAYDGDGEIYGWSDTVSSITIFRNENMVECKGDHFILYASEGARYKAAKAVYPVEEG